MPPPCAVRRTNGHVRPSRRARDKCLGLYVPRCRRGSGLRSYVHGHADERTTSVRPHPRTPARRRGRDGVVSFPPPDHCAIDMFKKIMGILTRRADIDALVLVDSGFPNGYSQPVRSLPPRLLIWGALIRLSPCPSAGSRNGRRNSSEGLLTLIFMRASRTTFS